jgi:hypothetical protein
MSYTLPSNKFEILISPVIINNDNNEYENNHDILLKQIKQNYKSLFTNTEFDLYKNKHFDEQLYLYDTTIENNTIVNLNYNSIFYEINEFIIKHNIFKGNPFKKKNIFIISSNNDEIVEAIKLNNIEHNTYFTFSSYKDNFGGNLKKEHIFDFMFFDILLENNDETNYYQHFISSILAILNFLKKNGVGIFKINLDIYSKTSEFIYLLSYLFKNVTIVQLESSKNMSLFIQCNDFIINENRYDNYNKNKIKLCFLLKTINNSKINMSLFKTNIPYFFNTKINNIKNVILQQQMEIINNINNFLYSNYTFLEDIKNPFLHKLNQLNNQKIKKTISWCNKYKIPISI